jgi:hypothetical protein
MFSCIEVFADGRVRSFIIRRAREVLQIAINNSNEIDYHSRKLLGGDCRHNAFSSWISGALKFVRTNDDDV